jgi:hypothetical protein
MHATAVVGISATAEDPALGGVLVILYCQTKIKQTILFAFFTFNR